MKLFSIFFVYLLRKLKINNMGKWNSEKENLEKLINDGVSYVEIGRMYGCSDNNIRKVAQNLGIILPKKRSINPNEHFNKIENRHKFCLNCNKEIAFKNKYCDIKCKLDYEYKHWIDEWKNGLRDGVVSQSSISNHIRRYLFEKYENKCCKCEWNIVNPYTNLIPLQVHHKDGNALNNLEENLELICPNCHSLTDNYGSKNKNSKRIRK